MNVESDNYDPDSGPSNLDFYPAAPNYIQLIQPGFAVSIPDPLYMELSGTTYAQVKDNYGNPVANVLAAFTVTEGGGKLMNTMARWCRDNAEDPFASYCAEQPDSGVAQSTAIPETLDTLNHYRNNVCCPDPESGCPEGWTPDDQCGSISWWTDSLGYTSAEWILGPAPPEVEPFETVEQEAVLSLPDYPVSPIWIQGQGWDLPAGSTWLQQILLSSMVNGDTQPAGASLPYPFITAMFYRHDEASADPENPPLPMVRIDFDDLLEVDQPPPGDYRVVYYVTEGGLSDRPERTGQEVQRLEVWPGNYVYGTADLAGAFWHLDCPAGDTQRIEMHPMRYLTYVYQEFQITSSNGPCVNQGDLSAVDCVSGATIDLMPFSPDTFCLKATTSDASTAPYTVKLVSYKENGLPILQPTAPDWERPYEIPVTLLYNNTLGYHLSQELEGQEDLSGSSAAFQNLSASALSESSLQSILSFFARKRGRVNVSGLGAATSAGGFRIYFMTSEDAAANPVRFDQIIGRDGTNNNANYYLKALLSNDGSLESSLTLNYDLVTPGNEVIQSGVFVLNSQGSLTDPVVEYRGTFPLDADTADSVLEYAVFDTSDPEDGRAFRHGAVISSIGVPPASRGEAIYLLGFDRFYGAILLDCDSGWKPCHDDATFMTDSLEALTDIRYFADPFTETPNLNREFVKAGGLKLIQAYLPSAPYPRVKGWIQDQADVVYFSGHGFQSGRLSLVYDPEYSNFGPDELQGAQNNEWDKDVDIVIFSACDELSLCDDEPDHKMDNAEGYDPRCEVIWDTNQRYDSAYPPTNYTCSHCTGGFASFGGQTWRALTTQHGNTVEGPKLYLGYYNEAPYGPRQAENNVDTEIMADLMQCLRNRGGFSDSDLNLNEWTYCWLEANLTAERPAAVIDARSPDNMQYWAVFRRLNSQQQLVWTSEIIYPDLDTSRP